MKKLLLSFSILSIMMVYMSCATKKESIETKVWAWMSSKALTSPEQYDNFFGKAADAHIDAIILEVHGGYPVGMQDTTDFVDHYAIETLKKAVPYAKKYGIELHAWIWTLNRCEMNLRTLNRDWYQVNAEDSSCLDIKLYNREHYRWLCPSRPEVTEYLKDRVAELAEIDGVSGVHLDFIRYPDAMLPYGLHESRGVVQDKIYPHWDHCYCKYCRNMYKDTYGTDPMTLENPTDTADWMKYRLDAVVKLTNALADEIHKHGKVASAAVFASPSESRKLVRQDWSRFTHLDIEFPMIYHKFYDKDDEWVGEATEEGVKEMKGNGCKGYLCSGLFVGHVPADSLSSMFNRVSQSGSKGVCIFSLEGVERTTGYWEALGKATLQFKENREKAQK